MPYITPDGLDDPVIAVLEDELRRIKQQKTRWEGLIRQGVIPPGPEGEVSINYIGPVNEAVKALKKVYLEVKKKLDGCEEGMYRFRSSAEKDKYRQKDE